MDKNTLAIILIVVSVLIIISVLLQVRSGGAATPFGIASGGEFYRSRRGMEKFLFYSTIILTAFLSAASIFASILLK
jgi:protein translocase SecG subunit